MTQNPSERLSLFYASVIVGIFREFPILPDAVARRSDFAPLLGHQEVTHSRLQNSVTTLRPYVCNVAYSGNGDYDGRERFGSCRVAAQVLLVHSTDTEQD